MFNFNEDKELKEEIAKALMPMIRLLSQGNISEEHLSLMLADYVIGYKRNPNCPS